jgi:O-antigen/teichoic acid export membrane protein
MTNKDAPGLPGKANSLGDYRSAAGSASLHKRLTLNSASNVLRFVISLVVTFFLTPFVIRTLGDAAYGFWVVLLSLVGYAGILEFGVQPAVVKLVGQYRGSPDREKLEELITAALLFFATVGVLAALFVAFAVPPLVPHLVKGLVGFDGLRVLLLLIAADVVIVFLNYLFTGILYGWQLYHAKNLVDISARLLSTAIVFLFLSRGGLILLAASKAATDLAALLVTILLCKRALPEVRLAFRQVGRSSFAELLTFGGKLFVSATSARASSYTQPIIISSQLSAAATTFFAIPARLAEYSRQIMWALSTAFMPTFSELAARQESALLRSIYLSYSRYLITLILPIQVLIFVYGRDFIGVWIGPEYAERGHAALHFLTAAVVIQGLQPLVWRLFIGVGRLNLMVVTSSTAALLTIILSFLLVGPMGITGVALSALVTAGATQLVFYWHASRHLEISIPDHFREVQGRPLLVGAVYFAVASLIARLLGADTYAQMALGVLLSLLVYVPLAFMSLPASERRNILRLLRTRISAKRKQAD